MKPKLEANNPQRPTGVAVQRVVRHHRTEKCETCNGLGWYLTGNATKVRDADCEDCNGKGRRPVTPNIRS